MVNDTIQYLQTLSDRILISDTISPREWATMHLATQLLQSRMHGRLNDQRTPGMGEAEEGGEERRRGRRALALHEGAIGAPTSSACTVWPTSDTNRWEAFVFLHIPKDDPTIVQYFLCIPNQDVQADDELRLHRTAIGQVLAFTLQALAAEAPPQEWHDVAHDKLTTWKVEYLDVLREIPETLREDPRASNYRPSHWKRDRKVRNTRSRAQCQPGASTPKHSSTEGSGSDQESHSPSAAAASRSQSSRGRVKLQSARGSERTQAGRNNKQTSQKDGQSTRPYCTIACIRGMVNRDPLDKECPNRKLHGGQSHSVGPQGFTRRLHRQLSRNETMGLNNFTSVVGRVTSSRRLFYYTDTL
ncbi:hypothetical protein CBS147333_10113 [Penicillium roqueforti]|nr:hypothetical protein CBS147333_10113 [Penicillium roqueforti]KAI3189038.1 hypothetical protein CBS147311_9991 [Penicillium roqueforti]KAI3261330.1 hypothetical protein CBS147308_9818 [Penicillium roqueforti]KAI3277987.1 hypothetical protein DTO003C3_9907 [Penicillium roqueforti]